LLGEITAAIKQQNEPPPPAPANNPRPVRFPVFNSEIPPER